MNSAAPVSLPEAWPALPIREWSATKDTLQLWAQIAGKVRLVDGKPGAEPESSSEEPESAAA